MIINCPRQRILWGFPGSYSYMFYEDEDQVGGDYASGEIYSAQFSIFVSHSYIQHDGAVGCVLWDRFSSLPHVYNSEEHSC